jgi:hypothetical protein
MATCNKPVGQGVDTVYALLTDGARVPRELTEFVPKHLAEEAVVETRM